MKISTITSFITFVLTGSVAFAQSLPIDPNASLTAGMLAVFNDSDYATDDKVGVLPLFLYDNNRLYIEGAEAGVYAYKDEKHWLRGGITYDGRHFDPSDAKTQTLKTLDKRKTSINAHASYMYITPVGGFELKASTDILDRSDAQTVSFAHRSKFVLMNDQLTIYPKFGVTWHSDDYNAYYYGVSAKEATKTGLSPYSAQSGYSPFVSVSAKYQFNKRWGLFGSQHMEWLSSAQKNSPLTDGKIKSTTRFGLTFQF